MKLACASFFAGIGGIDIGFEETGFFKTIYANEFDKYAAETYDANFDIKTDCRDIRLIPTDEIPDFDVLLAGFPCQAFSVAGYRKGFDDAKGRGTLFFELIRIMREKKPSAVFLENVKNLVGHDGGRTFSAMLNELRDIGYCVKHAVLNAMDCGNIPQNRERVYAVGFRSEQACRHFDFPRSVRLESRLADIIDFVTPQDEKYYYRANKYKGDIYAKLVEAMDDENAVYQWRRTYVRKNKSGVIPTLTANQGEGGHNVCLIKTRHGIRKMTPRECFNAQGFPSSFKLPAVSDGRLYKQAGNSVCVSVIRRIAREIFNALRSVETKAPNRNAASSVER